jgi:hypothetical protein
MDGRHQDTAAGCGGMAPAAIDQKQIPSLGDRQEAYRRADKSRSANKKNFHA